MKVGDLVVDRYKNPRDMGVIVYVYCKHQYLSQQVKVMWADGICTIGVDTIEVMDEFESW